MTPFNAITKCLSFNLYDFVIARTAEERDEYLHYVNSTFSSSQLSRVLTEVAQIIGAEVLNVSEHDYEPEGASSMILMSDGVSSVNLHLDSSHICAHTYLDMAGPDNVCGFRVDIDIATCGSISPLRALNHMFRSLRWHDVVIIDYVVRGYTRDRYGRRVHLDQEIDTIQSFIDDGILDEYICEDLKIRSSNIWQTKMLRETLRPSDYFPDHVNHELPENLAALEVLQQEMAGVFQGG